MDRIETDGLGMRPICDNDASFFCGIYGDPVAMRFLGPPLALERAERSFRRVLALVLRRPIERVCMVIIEKATQQAIGLGGYQEFDHGRHRLEAGMILQPAFQGRGFGKQGLGALVEHAFTVFPVQEVWIQHAANNQIARRVPVSLGFTYRNELAATDRRLPQSLWSAYRDSWRPRPGYCRCPACQGTKVPTVKPGEEHSC